MRLARAKAADANIPKPNLLSGANFDANARRPGTELGLARYSTGGYGQRGRKGWFVSETLFLGLLSEEGMECSGNLAMIVDGVGGLDKRPKLAVIATAAHYAGGYEALGMIAEIGQEMDRQNAAIEAAKRPFCRFRPIAEKAV